MNPQLRTAAVIALCALAAAPRGAHAQDDSCRTATVIVPDPFGYRFDAARLLQLTGGAEHTGSLFLRRVSAESGMRVCADSTRFLDWATRAADTVATRAFQWAIVPPSVQLGYNSDYPRDRNNGAIWGGVGTNAAASLGVRARWRWFDLQLAPQFYTEENADFEIVPSTITGRSSFVNPYHGREIDWYQRPGDTGRNEFDPGQSFIRATWGPASAGFGTENVWVGPNRIHSILMSSTAGGFPHAFLETSRPVSTPIGGLELRAVWGKLSESDWFDGDSANDQRRIAVLVAAWSPRWIPGFSFGAARVYEEQAVDQFSLGDWFGITIDRSFLSSTGFANRSEGNAIAGLFGRWAFPSAGFEVFGEWMREDTPWDMEDVLTEPDWTQAYALGFQQLIRPRAGSYAVRWYGELIHLGESAPLRAGRGLFSYYTHAVVIQGHTQRGQLLGGWTGPGSDAQILGMDLLYPRGLSGFWIERNRYDDDTYYRRFADTYAETRHDAEFNGGIRQLYSVAGFELEGSLSWGVRFNRNFLGLDGLWHEERKDNNLSLNLRAQWVPHFAQWQTF